MKLRLPVDRIVEILAELDAAPRGEKGAAMVRLGVTRQEVSRWRKAQRDGSLGQPRGRKRHRGWEAAIERLDKIPRALKILIGQDPALAASDLVPTPEDLHEGILDDIVAAVDLDVLPSRVEVSDDPALAKDWEKDVKTLALLRLPRKRAARREELALLDLKPDEIAPPRQGETDWLGDRRIVAWGDLCRRGDCPCARLCGVKHLHAGDDDDDEALPKGVPARPPRIVCLSRTCGVNRYALSWKFGNVLHMHWPKRAEADLSRARPADRWTSAADCPWHGVCDPAHERREDSKMIPFAEDLHYAYPVEYWCIDPACGHHRRGMPHVHCAVCREPVPYLANKHEIDLSSMERVDAVEPGPLCEKHYFELRAKIMANKPG